jgi:hypothetical protein
VFQDVAIYDKRNRHKKKCCRHLTLLNIVVHNLGEVTGDHCGIDISKLSDVVDPSIVMLNVCQCPLHSVMRISSFGGGLEMLHCDDYNNFLVGESQQEFQELPLVSSFGRSLTKIRCIL